MLTATASTQRLCPSSLPRWLFPAGPARLLAFLLLPTVWSLPATAAPVPPASAPHAARTPTLLAAFSAPRAAATADLGPRRRYHEDGLFGVPFSSVFVPQITVTKTDQILGDDGDGLADPGETIRYTVEIANAVGAMDATGVVFSDTVDPNTTLVPGSENASPVAFDTSGVAAPGSTITLTLTGADGDGDALTFSIVSPPSEGTLGPITPITPDRATVAYTAPAAPSSSMVTFTFKVNDGTVDANEDATVTIALDAAPEVSAVTPADGATAVAVDTDLDVTFTEAVTLAGDWFEVVCSTSGTYNPTGSGGATTVAVTDADPTFTLDPAGDFASDEDCTLTVFAAQVTDDDAVDPPDNMPADTSFTFSTDAAPTVTNTDPADGAADVPVDANIEITFSEDVNVAGAWFAIACTVSSAHTAAVTGTAPTTTYTLDPDVDFVLSETCTVTLTADAITDDDGGDPPNTLDGDGDGVSEGSPTDDFAFSFTTPDAPPQVTTTTPADGATNVSNTQTVTIDFSEAVDIADGAISVECPAGVPVAFSGTPMLPAGGIMSIDLDPAPSWPGGETCVVVLTADAVTDTDAVDPPDGLDGDGDGTGEGSPTDDFSFSFSVAPAAIDDAYDAIGNVGDSVNAAAGVLANDEGAGLSVDQVQGNACTAPCTEATTQGGSVTMSADGGFFYSPPAGFTGGDDTFTYRASGAAGTSNTATVTITVADMVWFIDSTPAAAAKQALAGTGTLADPFTDLAGFNAVQTGARPGAIAGDCIFLFSGTYGTGIVLLDDQALVGQGAGDTLANICGLTVPANSIALPATGLAAPVIALGPTAAPKRSLASDRVTRRAATPGTDGITLAQDNTVRGVDVGNTPTGFGLIDGGTNIGTPTISEVAITGTGGAVSFANGGDVSNVAFDELSATNAPAQGINLVGIVGTMTISASSTGIITPTGAAVNVDGGSAGFTFPGNLTKSSPGAGINITNGHTGTITFDTGTINITSGTGLQFNNADGTYNFDGATTLNGGDAGIDIFGGSDGMFTFSSNTAITNPTGDGVNINGGSGQIDYDGTINNNANNAVDVRNRTGGTVTFGGAVTDTGAGVFLNSNTGATIHFTGGMALDTGANTAFTATGGGTVNVTGTNTIGATTALSGTAVNITDTAIGAGGVTFQRIAVNQGASGPDVTAIILDDTGSGTFDVTGLGTTAGSGGTIENITDADAITLNNTDGRVTFKNMIIEDIAATGDAAAAIGTRTGVDGIHGQTVDGGLTLDNVTMRRFSDNAIIGGTFAVTPLATTWNGLEILNSTIEDANRYHVGAGAAGRGDDSDEGLVRIVGIRGTVVIDNSTLQRGGELVDFFTATSGTLDMTVQRSNFIDSIKEFTCSGGTVNVGKAGIDVTVEGSLDAVIRIGDPAETNPALGNTFTNNATASVRIAHDAGTSGDIDVVISRNTFEVTDHLTGPAGCPEGAFTFNFPQGGVSLGPGGGTFEGIVSNNTFDEVMHADGGLGQLTITADDGGTSEFIVTGNTFRLPWDAPVRIVADGNTSMAVRFGGAGVGEPNTYVDGTVGEAGPPNDDLGAPFPSPFTPFHLNVRNGGALDLTIRQEVLPQHDPTSGFARSFDASINASGGTLNLYLDDSKSPDGYRLAHSGGTFNLFHEIGAGACSGSPTAQTILNDNDNTGGGMNDNTTPPVVTTTGTITCSTTAPTLPSITISSMTARNIGHNTAPAPEPVVSPRVEGRTQAQQAPTQAAIAEAVATPRPLAPDVQRGNEDSDLSMLPHRMTISAQAEAPPVEPAEPARVTLDIPAGPSEHPALEERPHATLPLRALATMNTPAEPAVRARPAAAEAPPEPVLLASSGHDLGAVAGLLDAPDVQAALPSMQQIAAAFPPRRQACAAGTCTWTIGRLPAGRSVTLVFDAAVNDPFPPGIPRLSNQGTLTADGGISLSSDDPDTGAADDPTITPVDNPARLVINEIDYDQPGADNAEFVELKNTGAVDVNLNNFDLVLVDGAGGGAAIYQTITLPDVVLPAGAYFVVCADAATVGNCDLDTTPDADLLQDGAPDAVALVDTSGTFVHDALSYEGDTGAPYTEGSGAGLEDPTAAGSPDDADKGLSRIEDPGGADGNDTDQNNVDFSARCITPGAANTLRQTNCGVPVFEITKADVLFDAAGTTPGEANPADTLAYTIEITNTGGLGINTVFTDTLGAHLTLVAGSVTTSQGSVTRGNDPGDASVEVALGDVDNSGTPPDAVIMFKALVGRPLPAAVDSVRNQGFVTADNLFDMAGNPTRQPTDDPDTAAPGDSTATAVVAASSLAASKTDALAVDADGDGAADPGETIRYTIVIENRGDQGVADLVFTDTPDPNTALVAGSVTTTAGTVTTGNGAGDASVQVDLAMLDGAGGATAHLTVTFDVVVAAPFPDAVTSVSNQGVVTAAGEPDVLTDDPDAPGAADPTRTAIVVEADLSLTKTASTTTPDFGAEVVFTLILVNDGPADVVPRVEVRDVLPAGVVYVGDDGGGRYEAARGLWRVGSVAVDAPDTLRITARVETTAAVTNTAEVTRAGLEDPDSTPFDHAGDDFAEVTLHPVASDLALEKTLAAFSENNSEVAAAFVLEVRNLGPSAATGVAVTDLLPAGVTLVDAAFSDATDTYEAATGVWAVGSLAVDATATLRLSVRAAATVALLNLAQITASDQVDPDVQNNLAGAQLGRDLPDPQRFRADVSLVKTVDEAEVDEGQEVVFRLRVTNGGPFTTAGVEVTDVLPSGLVFVSAGFSDPSDSYDDSTGVWTVGALRADSSAELRLRVRVEGTGEIVNTAEVSGGHLPDPDSQTGNGDAAEDDQSSAGVRVRSASRPGVEQASGTSPEVPRAYELGRAYPNPFNPETVLPVGLPEASRVRVEVFDVLGRRVEVLVDGELAAGRHTVRWRAGGLPTGVYFVRLAAGGVVQTRQVSLVK